MCIHFRRCNIDQKGGVDLGDFVILTSAWLSDPEDPRWNAACDISNPPDDIIDVYDLSVFAENWLTNK